MGRRISSPTCHILSSCVHHLTQQTQGHTGSCICYCMAKHGSLGHWPSKPLIHTVSRTRKSARNFKRLEQLPKPVCQHFCKTAQNPSSQAFVYCWTKQRHGYVKYIYCIKKLSFTHKKSLVNHYWKCTLSLILRKIKNNPTVGFPPELQTELQMSPGILQCSVYFQ